jgi:glycosyltransferase involved in cell wall biosynthesis
MEFSIIIPTYQEEIFIERCLNSILRQNYDKQKYEIIVSDAHSIDRTAEIAHKYADNVLVDNKKGIAYGRNAGSRIAKGDILLFIDADATINADFLLHCHQTFIKPGVVGMTGIAKPSDGRILQRLVYHVTYALVRLFNYFGLPLFPGICVAFKRDTFDKLGGFREDFGIVEDLDLSKRASHIGICTVNKRALAFVSTRRLERNLLSTVLFHIYCDIKYLFTGKAPAVYPKSEDIHSSFDLWKQLHHTTK